jgi:chromate transporter
MPWLMLGKLFVVFLKIGLFSFGGGYAVIPLIHEETVSRGWLADDAFRRIVTLAAMAPGPVAVNSATLIGYRTAGIAGAIASTLGIIFPSLAIVVLLAVFFMRLHRQKWLKSSLYGLRPVIAGIILYTAFHFALLGRDGEISWTAMAPTLFIAAGTLLLLIRYRLHPLLALVAAGAAGVIWYT